MTEQISYSEARELIDDLAHHFDVPSPALIWNSQKSFGQTHWSPLSIEIPALDRDDVISNRDIVIHEMAHVLTTFIYQDREDHGRNFWRALNRILDYLHYHDYPWWWEYEAQPWLRTVNNALRKFSARISANWPGSAQLTMIVVGWLRSLSARAAGRPKSTRPESVSTTKAALPLNVSLTPSVSASEKVIS